MGLKKVVIYTLSDEAKVFIQNMKKLRMARAFVLFLIRRIINSSETVDIKSFINQEIKPVTVVINPTEQEQELFDAIKDINSRVLSMLLGIELERCIKEKIELKSFLTDIRVYNQNNTNKATKVATSTTDKQSDLDIDLRDIFNYSFPMGDPAQQGKR
ncbi:hypothetical protein [Thermodesulfovibrio yellowstonii]|uniref:hypothetical protein n=1 Tax=Thermodesulfovibrio yellowstonii TaxID=28262 RepID=UPI003C7D9B07